MLFMTKKVVLGLVLSLTLSSDLYISSTMAQASTTTSAPAPTGTPTTPQPLPNAPRAFTNIASAVGKKYIYYQGGLLNQAVFQYSGELWGLDITKSWPISAGAWTNFTAPASGPAGPVTGGHSGTMSKDGSTFIVTAPSGNAATPFLYQYNIAAATWSTVNAPAAQASQWSTRRLAGMVTDPDTGAIWYVGGAFADGTATNELDEFQDGTWTANVTTSAPAGASSSAPSTLNNFSQGTTEIYNGRIYIFGGITSIGGQRGYQSFQSLPYIDVSGDKPTVGNQLTLGPTPPPRQNHCSALTDSAKVIIFGGYDANSKVTMNDVWSYDMITYTWSQIVPSNPTSPRYGHNCDIHGANMVVYGGQASATIGYGRDVQVYDVMQSTWMTSYTPKQDTTLISKPLSGGPGSKSGLSTGAVIGIVAGAVVVIAVIFGGILWKRRQKQIEIREAQLEKEAYLASLRPEGDGNKSGAHSPHYSPSRPAAMLTPGMSHDNSYQGMDQLLTSGAGSPGLGGQGQNVQYLMQHLPDGTIAVQPVYLDHQPMQMQTSPDMRVTEANGSSGYVSPPMPGVAASGSSGSGGYFAPPPSGSASATYVLPPTPAAQKQTVAYPQPTHDPFASPALGNAPMPPNYGSPQQTHPEHRK
ncbi:hypothetical protein BGZ59_010347 [Podila verticillata]|nr:hypothetical protein BGZ59_010347 [Podila verticillata]KFH63356.1 hypothetical protein MVEG_10766 [Podila verticillata NRRL 6337]